MRDDWRLWAGGALSAGPEAACAHVPTTLQGRGPARVGSGDAVKGLSMRMLLLALCVLLVAPASLRQPFVLATSGTPLPSVDSIAGRPGASLRTRRVRTYSMSGQIRPLLFWIGQDDIGLARVTWLEGGEGARGYELLVGTDPAKAPRALNRWGLVAEETRDGQGTLLALMTGSPDTSFDDATSPAGRGGVDFHAIRHETRTGGMNWHMVRVRTASAMTVHDVDSAIARVARESSRGRRGETPLHPDTRPGFLIALAELVERGAGRPLGGAQLKRLASERLRFVFGREIFELRLKESRPHVIDLGAQPTPVVTSAFEIRTLASGARTRFDVTFGTTGSLADVPVAAEWQPRWWLKVRLYLNADTSVDSPDAGG